jgi:hypothetical protein
VPGAADGALHRLADAGDGDRRGEAGRVDDLGRRGEQDVGAGRGGQLGVAGLVARVGVEVGGLVELRGVDEERHDDGRAALARLLDQGEVALVQRAHRRDQADRPRRLAQRGADVVDGAHGDHAGTLRRAARSRVAAGQRVEELEQLGRRSATASRWRSTVASSPRAIGPVSACSAPRRAQLSTVWRTSGTSSSRSPPRQPLGGRLERDQEVRGHRRGGVVAARSSSATTSGAVPRPAASWWAKASASEVEPAIAAPARRTPRAARRRERHQRMDAEGVGVAGQDVEAGGPAAVADEQVVARRQTSRGGGDLAVRDAQEDRRGGTRVGATAQGTVDREAGGAQSAGEGAAQTAGPDEGDVVHLCWSSSRPGYRPLKVTAASDCTPRPGT